MTKNNLNSYSRKERLGFIIIVSLIIVGITIWQMLYHQQNSIPEAIPEQTAWDNFQETNLEWKSDAASTSNENIASENAVTFNDASLKEIAYNPKAFNPNSATIEEMIAAGVPIGSAKRIIKYRNKGGQFYDKEKLQNFGFTEEEYKKVAPYIAIPKKEKGNYSNNYKTYDNSNYERKSYAREPEPTSLNLNTATAEDLMKFKGIGPGFSKRIIEYRNRLGGFLKIEQLKEVYGLPDSTYLHIKDRLVIDNNNIQKMNINVASEEQLANHPYIGKYMAPNIIKLRNDLKEFKNISDLRQVPLINEEKYRKIVPYLKIN